MQYIYVMDFRTGEVHIYQTERMDNVESEKFIRLKGHVLQTCEFMISEYLKLHVH